MKKPGAAAEASLRLMMARRLLERLDGHDSITLTSEEVEEIIALLAVRLRGRKGRAHSQAATERDMKIAEQDPRASAASLAEKFNVDESTIRRARRKFDRPGKK